MCTTWWPFLPRTLLPPTASAGRPWFSRTPGSPPGATKRGHLSPPPSPMASTATWALASPSAVAENRGPSRRQPLPAAPHCPGLLPQRRLLRAGASRYCCGPPVSKMRDFVVSCFRCVMPALPHTSQRTSHNVTVMASGESITPRRRATGETVATTVSGEAPGEGSTELPEIVKTVQKAWDKVEDKYAVATIGVAAIIALWASTGVISAIDRLPLVPGVLELVGIGYTGWFVYQNLVFQPDREALLEKIKSTYDDITGGS